MNDLFATPLAAIAITVGAYAAALALHRRYPHLHPLVVTTLLLAAVLAAMRLPVAKYREQTEPLAFLLGPATVALAVPLVRNLRHVRAHALPILAALAVGAVVGIGSAAACVYLLHGSQEVLIAMLPKSVTTPIAVEITKAWHGRPELTATFVVLTGLFGAVVGPRFLALLGIRNELALGLGMGAAAHGIGTASLVRRSELATSAAALAMGINGIVTSIILTALPAMWGR